MIHNKSSQTALVTCLIRAASHLEKIPDLKTDDFLAKNFILTPFNLLFKLEGFRRFFQKKLPHGTYEYIIARTKYFDSVFKYAIDNNFEQVVIFGAGFDSRGIRLNKNHQTRIFEIDFPATQVSKINKLEKSKIKTSNNLFFVPLDLNNSPLKETFKKFKIEKKKTLFIMEGLLMYLDPSSVDSLFKTVLNFSDRGSELVFDYVYSSVVSGKDKETKGVSSKEVVSKIGESWTFGIDNEKIKNFLEKRGFVLVENLNNEELIKKYFKNIPKNIEIRASGLHSIVRAKVIK